MREEMSRPEEEYDPYAHRARLERKTNSTFEAASYVVGSSIGTGVLVMPFAFKHAGLWLGMGVTVLLVILGTITSHMLVNCSRILCRKERVPAMDYSEVAIAAFNNGPERFRHHKDKLRILVEVLIIIDKGGTCCIYILFICYNTMFIVNYYLAQAGLQIPVLQSPRVWMIFVAIIMIPMNLSHDLKSIGSISYIATVMIVTGVILTVYYVVADPKAEDTVLFAHFTSYPLFCGITIFVTNSITSLLPVEENMRHPQEMSGPILSVINISNVIVLMIYGAYGWFGYQKYGSNTKSVITLNLPRHEIIAQISMGVIVVGTLFSYSIHFYVMFLELWRHVELYLRVDIRVAGTHWFRVILVLITTFLSMAIPNVGGFLSVIGSIGLSMLALVIPPFMDSLIHWETDKGTKRLLRTTRNIAIMLVGLMIAIFGTIMGLVEIAMNYNKPIEV